MHACLLVEAWGLPALVAHAFLLLVAFKVNLGSRFSKFIVLLLQ
jgi:hypothetical protein